MEASGNNVALVMSYTVTNRLSHSRSIYTPQQAV